jgi:hypothetical protein
MALDEEKFAKFEKQHRSSTFVYIFSELINRKSLFFPCRPIIRKQLRDGILKSAQKFIGSG